MTVHATVKDKKGRPLVAIVPWLEYQDLLAMAYGEEEDDALVARALKSKAKAKDGESIPSDVVRKIFVEKRNRIAVFREWRGMTQRALAKAVESEAAYISQIETGKAQAGRKMLLKLAKALKLPLSVLVD